MGLFSFPELIHILDVNKFREGERGDNTMRYPPNLAVMGNLELTTPVAEHHTIYNEVNA